MTAPRSSWTRFRERQWAGKMALLSPRDPEVPDTGDTVKGSDMVDGSYDGGLHAAATSSNTNLEKVS